MTIGTKLFLGFGSALGVTLALSFVAVNGIGKLAAATDELVKVTAKKRYLVTDTSTAIQGVLAAERGILVRAYMRDRATMEQYNQDFQDMSARIARNLDQIQNMGSGAEDRRLTGELRDALETTRQGHSEFWSQVSAHRIEAASLTYKNKTNPAIKQMVKTSEAAALQQSGLLQKAAQEAQEVASRARWMTLAMIGLSVLVVALAVFVVRQINTILRLTVTELKGGGEQVAAAAEEIASSSQGLSQGASEQAASLEEISASMDQMSAMTKRNAENSNQAMSMMQETSSHVERSNHALQDMVSSMTAIKESSEKVARINKTIDEIAFQTNILALNAAVEAARAGSAGMGFAVVADEVRNLAQRSAVAAKDTALLIEEAIANSTSGAAKLDHVAEAIAAITVGAAKVKNLVDEVNEASKQQSLGIDQVATAITQVSSVTQNAAASAEQSAAASQQLSAQSQTMRRLVEDLQVLAGTGRTRSAVRCFKAPAQTHSSHVSRQFAPTATPAPEEVFPMEPAGKSGGGFEMF